MNELLADVRSAIGGLGPLMHTFAGKRVLLTGARGFLGRLVVAAFIEMNTQLAKPCTVIAVDSLLTDAADKTHWMNLSNVRCMQQDVKCGVGHIAEKLDYVMHLAGIASPYWYKKLPLETIAVAVDGSRHMLELAKEHGARYLFTSSSEVYQTASVVPTPENYVGAIPSFTDRSCYDVSKLLGEVLVYIYAQQGADATCVRIFNSFAAGMSEKDRRILPAIASAMKADRPITIFSRPMRSLPRRTYTPAANTLLGVLLTLLKGVCGEAYNVGLDSPEITVEELCERISRVTGREVRREFVPAPSHYESEPMRRCPDITKLRGLGFQPVVDLDTGLDRFFKWALETYTG